MQQLHLFARSRPAPRQPAYIVSMAYVPPGLVCCRCGRMLYQCLPVRPEQCGYITADWRWHIDGRAWTTAPVSQCGECTCTEQ